MKCSQIERNSVIVEKFFPIELSFIGKCEELISSSQLKREIKRIFRSLTERLDIDLALNLEAEIYNFQFFIFCSTENPCKTEDYRGIFESVELLLENLGLEKSEYRINLKALDSLFLFIK